MKKYMDPTYILLIPGIPASAWAQYRVKNKKRQTAGK